jgi:hypothetical protein
MNENGFNEPFTRPILGIANEQFVKWILNFDLVTYLFREVVSGVTTALTSVVRSDHQGQSEIQVLFFYLFIVLLYRISYED